MTSRSAPPRRRLSIQERRELLLQAGWRLFGDRGVDDVAVGDIAAEAGVSAGLLYHYFGSKREFHEAVTRYACDRLEDVTRPDQRLEPGVQLVTSMAAYLEYLRDNAGGWTWLLRGGGGSSPEMWSLGARVRAVSAGYVLAALPPAAVTPVVVMAVKGWVGSNAEISLAWLEDGQVDLDEVLGLTVAVLFGTLDAAGVPGPFLAALREQARAALADRQSRTAAADRRPARAELDN